MTMISGHESLDDLRRHPARLAFAAGFAVLLVAWTRLIDWRPFLSNGEEFIRLGDLLMPVSAVTLALAPLLALRWTVLPAALAVSPVLISFFGSTGVPITVYVGLVLAGAVAWQRSRRAGTILAGLGVAFVAPIILVPLPARGLRHDQRGLPVRQQSAGDAGGLRRLRRTRPRRRRGRTPLG